MEKIELRSKLQNRILAASPGVFEDLAMEVFHYQYQQNPVYHRFVNLLSIDPNTIKKPEEIPFMPISFFKNHSIKTGEWEESQIFRSSGTTGTKTSQHMVRDPNWYLNICDRCFHAAYANPKEFCFLALLPAYLERRGSSLVFMVNHFIENSVHQEGGFFLYNTDALIERIQFCQSRKIPTILIGVSFALLDLAEKHQIDLNDLIIMETGGMKGRRKEITRMELHRKIAESFSVSKIHSEYGMTEMMSQCYSKGEGIFHPGPTVRILTREINDPFARLAQGRTGLVDVIDLGNLDTGSFIATDDLGKVYNDGSFEITGRLDASDIRGCNLLIDTY